MLVIKMVLKEHDFQLNLNDLVLFILCYRLLKVVLILLQMLELLKLQLVRVATGQGGF